MTKTTKNTAFLSGVLLAVLFGGTLHTPFAWAEVKDSAAHGFTVRSAVDVEASPGTVWAKLIHDVGRWWDSNHTFSLDAANLSIDARPGGCFCETLPDGGGVRHLEVVTVMPRKALRLVGGLGPLQAQAVHGALTYTVQALEDGAGTRVELVYAVSGYAPDGLESWAAPVDGVLTTQLERFGRYVETGSPEAPK